MFIVDDLVAIALFALMGKLAHDVITEEPRHDDDDLGLSTYRFGSAYREPSDAFLPSLNTASEESYMGMPNFSSSSSPSRRRPRSFVFDRETGEFWEE